MIIIIRLPNMLLFEDTGAVFGTGKKENKSKALSQEFFC